MQRAVFPHSTSTQFPIQATRVIPVRGHGLQDQASNDDSYHDENSLVRMVLSVLANVIGGAILLSGMFVLPHIIAKILS